MRPSVFLSTLAVLLASCSHSEPAPATPPRPAPVGPPVEFAYPSADDAAAVTSTAMRGRASVLIFITTYDLASQAEARFLTMVMHRHVPRIRAAAIALEPQENRPLVAAFRDALHLEYPVAMADKAVISGGGPFGDVHAVPTTVVLDARGRVVARHVGLARDDEIESMLVGL